MILETERLILRPWEEGDAEECFRYAKDPRVGPAAGWPAHQDPEESWRVIRDILAVPETYAMVPKETGLPAGSVSLNFGTALAEKDDEAELGYWLGVPFWGRGYMPEAARELLRRAFEDLGLRRVWCAWAEGNDKSRRVQEKLGFRHQFVRENVPYPQIGEKRTSHVNLMTKEDWETYRDSVSLFRPGIRDLWFRQLMLSDETTMSYNRAWGGTIDFPEEDWAGWYGRWLEHPEGERYYCYLTDLTGRFLGEIAYHRDEELDGFIANVIVYSKYRGRGYGGKGLELLCCAAAIRGCEALWDDIAIDNPAVGMFLARGFREEFRTEDRIFLKKDLKEEREKMEEELCLPEKNTWTL